MEGSKRGHLPGVIRAARIVMLVLATLVVLAATIAAIAESYDGLYNWALEHQFLPGWEAAIAPLMVDTFIVLGEAMLFVLIVDRRRVSWIWIPVIFSVTGLALSFGGNVARLQHAGAWTRLGHGLAPIAAAAGLVGAMVLLHLIAGDYSKLLPASEPAAEPAVTVPPAAPVEQRPRPAPPAPVLAAAPARKAPAAVSGNNAPPTVAQLEDVRRYLRSLPDGSKLPADRALAIKFFDGRQRRAMGRVLSEPEFQNRGNSALIQFPVEAPAASALVNGKAAGSG